MLTLARPKLSIALMKLRSQIGHLELTLPPRSFELHNLSSLADYGGSVHRGLPLKAR
jgi:hypothetical protein